MRPAHQSGWRRYVNPLAAARVPPAAAALRSPFFFTTKLAPMKMEELQARTTPVVTSSLTAMRAAASLAAQRRHNALQGDPKFMT
jgi:hypothetical protein